MLKFVISDKGRIRYTEKKLLTQNLRMDPSLLSTPCATQYETCQHCIIAMYGGFMIYSLLMPFACILCKTE